jgi:hypothetical protein
MSVEPPKPWIVVVLGLAAVLATALAWSGISLRDLLAALLN